MSSSNARKRTIALIDDFEDPAYNAPSSRSLTADILDGPIIDDNSSDDEEDSDYVPSSSSASSSCSDIDEDEDESEEDDDK